MIKCTCGFTSDISKECNLTCSEMGNVYTQVIKDVWQRHLDGGIGGKEWTNFHGLEECDCEELTKWMISKWIN